ncbi:hypothetical protein [Clostridium perfringens]|nr:hypothetical protein [Clostridium perfringens]MDM0528821.1 hypothetical protein [Clostridium perfringens]
MLESFLSSLIVSFLLNPLFWKLISKGALQLSILFEKIAIALSA